MLHQYRLIRECHVTPLIGERLPRLVPFMDTKLRRTEFNALFAHELAHVMEIFERGQIHRLKLQNLGWPVNNIGTFTAKAASAECKVFAMQWLLEEHLTGKLCEGSLLDFQSVALFLNSPRFWSKKDEFHGWASTRSPAQRLQDEVRNYRPVVVELLDATVNYMIEECAEHL